MRRKLTWMGLFSAAILLAAIYAGKARATPQSRFTATTLAMGQISDMDVVNQLVWRDLIPRETNVWLSWQKTIGMSDVYVQSNVWDVGGSTGWHTHPGHSHIIVTAGTVTAYEGDDRNCKPTVYTKGMAFVDPGGGHVHLLRNEGNVPASTIAFQLIPAGATRRIDAADPGNCRF
jgi:hypothetical protein